jgi:hypothetical protein
MKRVLLASFLVLGAAPALASGRNPQLPSSGIVIHLFGPEAGIPEQVTPPPAPGVAAMGTPAPVVSAPGAPASAAPAPGVTASAAPAAGGVAAASAPSAAAAAAQSAYPEPQLGTILHQMFITGDPNRGPGFSTGRPKAY